MAAPLAMSRGVFRIFGMGCHRGDQEHSRGTAKEFDVQTGLKRHDLQTHLWLWFLLQNQDKVVIM